MTVFTKCQSQEIGMRRITATVAGWVVTNAGSHLNLVNRAAAFELDFMTELEEAKILDGSPCVLSISFTSKVWETDLGIAFEFEQFWNPDFPSYHSAGFLSDFPFRHRWHCHHGEQKLISAMEKDSVPAYDTRMSLFFRKREKDAFLSPHGMWSDMSVSRV